MVADVVVHLLDIAPRQLRQLDLPDVGDDVEADVVPVPLLRRFADVGLGVELEPCFRPCADREFVRPAHVHQPGFLDGAFQLVSGLSLRLAEDVFADGLAVCVVSRDVATFPASVAALADVALAACPAFCHVISASFGSTTPYRRRGIIAIPGTVCYQNVINLLVEMVQNSAPSEIAF